ncbi:MAG: hypothetical protein B7Z52_00610, partial [Burkholderiales bacterium 12-64-5]
GAFWGLGAVSATGFGLDENAAAVFMTVAVLAGAVTQLPIGRLSDRMDRRLVLAGLLVAAIGVALALGLARPSGPAGFAWLLVLAAAFGGCALPCYSIAAAHAYDHADPTDYVGTASSLLLVNGLGSIAGPMGAALLMRAMPGGGLFLFIAATQAALLGFVLWRLRRRAAPAPEARESFDVAATATVGAVIAPGAEPAPDQGGP